MVRQNTHHIKIKLRTVGTLLHTERMRRFLSAMGYNRNGFLIPGQVRANSAL
jgi:hypothetical protein